MQLLRELSVNRSCLFCKCCSIEKSQGGEDPHPGKISAAGDGGDLIIWGLINLKNLGVWSFKNHKESVGGGSHGLGRGLSNFRGGQGSPLPGNFFNGIALKCLLYIL